MSVPACLCLFLQRVEKIIEIHEVLVEAWDLLFRLLEFLQIRVRPFQSLREFCKILIELDPTQLVSGGEPLFILGLGQEGCQAQEQAKNQGREYQALSFQCPCPIVSKIGAILNLFCNLIKTNRLSHMVIQIGRNSGPSPVK